MANIFNDILRTIQPGKAAQADQRQAESQSRVQNSEVNQLIAAIKATADNPKEQAGFVSQLKQTATFQKFQVDTEAVAQAQTNRVNGLKKADELSVTSKRLIEAGFITEDDDTHKALGQQAKNALIDSGHIAAGPEEIPTAKRTHLSAVFSEGLDSLKETAEGHLATVGETQAFHDKFVAEAQKKGVQTSAADVLFGELFDEETGKRGAFRNDILPKTSKAADFFGFEAPKGKPQDKTVSDDEVVKKFDDFVQTSTPDFPIDNTPKNFKALGLTTTADQQQFQELQKAAPEGIDVQQFAQQSPEDFKRMLAMLRTGKTPGGKKFTIKDALKIMGNL